MIVKPLEYPYRALQLETLIARLKQDHPSISAINRDYQLKMAGFRGELAVDYPLSFLPNDEYYILHDLRLWDGNHFFQIDILILHATFALILEVKNIVGEIFLDIDLHQLIRVKDGETTAFADPTLQVNRLKSQLNTLLRNAHFPTIPIYTFVVFSNTNSALKLSPSQIKKYKDKVIHKEYLPERIMKLPLSSDETFLSHDLIKKLIKFLKKKHTPLETDILAKYQISTEDIIPGVKCVICNNYSLKKSHVLWYCPICQHKTMEAVLPALKDYYFLFGERITNRQLRHFLQLDSMYKSSRILKNLNLKVTGSGKSTVHHLHLKLFKSLLEVK